jgi:hypothetical protein
MKLNKMIKSDMFYYVAVVLMVINILGYVSVGSVECVIVFALATYLSNMYTKNRSLDILIGLFASNIVFGCGRVKEGMENPEDKIKEIASELLTEAKVLEGKKKCKPGDKDKECVDMLKAASTQLQNACKKIKEVKDKSGKKKHTNKK